MLRKVRFGVAALGCIGIWAVGFWRFATGETLLGSALILVAGIVVTALWGLYSRDGQAAGEGVIDAILGFIHWR